MTRAVLAALALACAGKDDARTDTGTDAADADTDADGDTDTDADTDTDSDADTETASTADTAVPPLQETGTATCVPDTDTAAPPVDTGEWVVPSPSSQCEVADVASVNPGPVVDASTLFLTRVQGNARMRCDAGLGLGDNDRNGHAEFAVACEGDPGRNTELWLFDGAQTGILHDTDAATIVHHTSNGDQSLAIGRLTTTADRSLAVSLESWFSDITVIDLPAPPGTWDLSAVATASVEIQQGHDGFPLGVGDVDGDGVHDLAVGSISPEPLTLNGGVSIYRGPLVGTLDPIADAWAYYEATAVDVPAGNYYYSGNFTTSIVGDVDCDGVADILLPGEQLRDVAPNDPIGYSYDAHGGAVFFGGGSPGGHSFADAKSLLYASCDGYVGSQQTLVGDVTGDGLPDVAFGGPEADIGGQSSRGVVFVVSDVASHRGYTSMAEASAAIFIGERGGDLLFPSGRLGDLDGDGVDDLVLSAWWGEDNGRAYVFLGPVAGTIHVADADLVLHGGPNDVRFGYSVFGVGDVDGDGVPDLMVGAQASNWDGQPDAGAVYLFSGAALLSAM